MTHTLKEVIDTLKQIAVEMPDEQTQCFYSNEAYVSELESFGDGGDGESYPEAKTPLCVIGHLVSRLDGVEGLQKLRENRAVNEQRDVFESLGYSDESMRYMARVQRNHDDGDTFQGAVESGTAGA